MSDFNLPLSPGSPILASHHQYIHVITAFADEEGAADIELSLYRARVDKEQLGGRASENGERAQQYWRSTLRRYPREDQGPAVSASKLAVGAANDVACLEAKRETRGWLSPLDAAP